jgi:hypothetical protein
MFTGSKVAAANMAIRTRIETSSGDTGCPLIE